MGVGLLADIAVLRNIGIQVQEDPNQIQQIENFEPNINTPNKIEKPEDKGTQTDAH